MFLIFPDAFYTFSILSLLVFHCRLLGLCWHWNPNAWEPWGQPVWFCNLHNHSRYLRDRRPCTVPEVGMTDVAWQVIVDHCCILSMSLLFTSSVANTSVGLCRLGVMFGPFGCFKSQASHVPYIFPYVSIFFPYVSWFFHHVLRSQNCVNGKHVEKHADVLRSTAETSRPSLMTTSDTSTRFARRTSKSWPWRTECQTWLCMVMYGYVMYTNPFGLFM